MPFRLISHSTEMPPGEFYYLQTEGIRKAFGHTPEIRKLARRVADFRRANSLPRPTWQEALDDIDAYTCARLKNNPRWCMETDASFQQIHPEVTPPLCAGCGIPLP